MTPDQKANELIEKFRPYALTMEIYNEEIETANAIQCAIVAVDEILIMRWNLPHYGSKEGMIFWQEVKTILTDRL